MDNYQTLIEKAKKGFDTLDLPQHFITDALVHLETWLSDDMFADYVPQIEHLIASGQWEFLLDSFYQVIPFGTGGRRGLVGVGPNRINPWTIQASAQGHSQYLIEAHGEPAKSRGVVLAYDVRQFTDTGRYDPDRPNPVKDLNCRQLAEAAARVYTANGIKVYLFESTRSTPELSFAIRHLGAISGCMFSASHNLPTDNGKKSVRPVRRTAHSAPRPGPGGRGDRQCRRHPDHGSGRGGGKRPAGDHRQPGGRRLPGGRGSPSARRCQGGENSLQPACTAPV